MLESEKIEYKKFKRLERVVLELNPNFYKFQLENKREFVHERYTYISYQTKDHLWRSYW